MAYLAIERKPFTRDHLAALFWPENGGSSARSNLRRTLSGVKNIIGHEVIRTEGETVRFDANAAVYVDVIRFSELHEQCMRKGPASGTGPDREPLKEAASLYTADFLSGFSISSSAEFDDWLFYTGDRLKDDGISILAALVALETTENKYENAITSTRKWLNLDPLSEEAHRTLMKLFAATGQRTAALRQYEECEKIVKREMEEIPEKETTDLYHAIRKNKNGPTDSRKILLHAPKRRWKHRSAIIYSVSSAVVIGVFLVLFFLTPLFGYKEKYKPAIVVLPLLSISEKDDQEWFATGMTDAITTQLAKISGLRVISHTSARAVSEQAVSLQNITKALDVDYIVEGTIIKVENWVRISVQLIRTEDDSHIWAYEYKQVLEEILMLQAVIARDIAEQVYVKLTADEEKLLTAERTVNPAAQEAYLRGFYNDHIGMSVESNEIGRKYYEKAIELDPNFALGFVGLANYYWGEVQFAEIPAEEGMPLAKEYIAKALTVNPNCAEAYTVSGFLKFLYDWDFKGAEEDFKKATWINPNHAEAFRWYGSLCGVLGQYDKAIEYTELASKLDPVSPLNAVNVAAWYYHSRQYERAIEICKNLLTEEPEFWMARWVLGWAYTQTGRYDLAVEQIEQTIDGVGLESLFRFGHVLAVAGREEEARKIIRRFDETAESQYVPAYYYAVIYTGLGDVENAFHYLDKAYEERHMHVIWEVRDPKFDILRNDPRWKQHLKRLSLK